ncbi:MAG: OmpH family outer membrane protein [Gammaproteobacteria bacterium]|nr:OmpH family outer membrane protein [Gammaproteobacteria bacterium]
MRFLPILFLLIPLQAAMAQEAGYKIGFVNTARVLKEAPQARKVEERLKSEFEPREAELKAKRKEILALEDVLKAEAKPSPAIRRKAEREIRLKVSQLKFLEQEFREDQNLRRNEEIRELQQVISNVLKTQGDSGGFDLILTEGVSYVSEQIDITAQTIEMLKQLPDSSEGTQ